MDASTRVIFIEELATEILRLLAPQQDLAVTLELRRVNKNFSAIISKLMWNDPPAGGLRMILANLGDYEVLGYRCQLREGVTNPDPNNWIRLQTSIGNLIQVLRLNFVAMHPLDIVPTITGSCPHLQLPNLKTLAIHMDIVGCQLQLATRFMQPTVTSFEIQAFHPTTPIPLRGPPRRSKTSTLIDNYEAMSQVEHDANPLPQDTCPRDFLVNLSASIASEMPHLTSLQLFVEYPFYFVLAPSAVPQMIFCLPELRNLQLPHNQTIIPVLGQIAAHRSLTTITRYRHSWHLGGDYNPRGVKWEVVDPATNIPHLWPNSLANIRTLHINIGVDRLLRCMQVWDTRALPNLRSLDIDTKAHPVSSNDALTALLARIAEHFPTLRELTICTIRFLKFVVDGRDGVFPRINAPLIAPLTALKELTALKITANHNSLIFADEWPALLQSWPHLRDLVLGHELRSASAPVLNMSPGTAPLDTILNIFVQHCPQIRLLSLHVDGTLAARDPASWTALPCSLEALELVLPRSSRSRADTTRSELLARYLKAVLPERCGLHVFNRAREVMWYTLCIGLDCDDMTKRCQKGLHEVMHTWIGMHEAEGRGCYPAVCGMTRGEVLIPLPTAPQE
ncbi:hypothetical protein PHLGIDRAFT_218495 [Phlebiopsis gigantea 11061_1 CR5-6]|uniref:Uncharacterized protein n=1 Tax=Phlebiopsis gigantea (strain 11061_1 CR5-6) TaxID=745531 RepID=A0A0C3S2L5_PHLG1|nr:hypothetical protein PHLGIDRAFT_218495 [Phlebiopsis gigantea 11061_1 CR5-6]